MMRFTDVTLRDGLQMEAAVIPVEAKLALFEKLLPLASQRIEITSFVNPKWIPQLSDANTFCEALFKDTARFGQAFSGKELMAFVPNEKGLDQMMAFPIPWATTFIATSETFNKKNVNTDIQTTLKVLGNVIRVARENHRKVRVYVSTVFGCPYEGVVSDTQVLSVLKKVADLGPDEVALSDTIGVALPDQVKNIVAAFSSMFDLSKTALHLHNTYDLAVAAAVAGYEAGVHSFDGTTGGIGGCPYAKGATGNVALEELEYLFYRLGRHPSWNPDAVFAATSYLENLGISIQSRIHDIKKKGGKLYGFQ